MAKSADYNCGNTIYNKKNYLYKLGVFESMSEKTTKHFLSTFVKLDNLLLHCGTFGNMKCIFEVSWKYYRVDWEYLEAYWVYLGLS